MTNYQRRPFELNEGRSNPTQAGISLSANRPTGGSTRRVADPVPLWTACRHVKSQPICETTALPRLPRRLQ